MYKKEVWSNGLRTIYVPSKNTQTVAIFVLVGTGAHNEEEKENGLSHFLEHMAFKGTEKRPDKLQIAQELDSVGAVYNAFTGKEYTGYWVKTDSKHLKLGIDVVSDIFLNSTIPAEEIEKERGVILGEIDMYEDIPSRKVGDVFENLLYGDQPAGRSILGTKKNIRSFKKEDFMSYRERNYRAKNTIVIVSGNFQLREAKKLVKEHFKDIRKGNLSKARKTKEKQTKPEIKIFNKKTDQTHLVLGTRSFSIRDKRRWPLSILNVILGGNMSSRLFIEVRDELGLGYYVRSGTSLYKDHGYFEVSAGVDNKRLEEAVEVILGELKKVKKDGITKAELKKAKDYIKGTTLISLESTDNLAAFYGMQELLERKILTPKEKLRIINKVNRPDVKKLTRDLFNNKNLNLALIGPTKNKAGLKKILKF